jgi:hypothetical protein
MTTVRRSYINHNYNRSVDDLCLEYKSIPMAVVKDIIKVKHPQNQYDGIKPIYNTVPPRPKDLNTMAVSIARINNQTYSTAVPNIVRTVAQEEVNDVRRFVDNQSQTPINNQWELNPYRQTYIPEQPTRSTSGSRLQPSSVALTELFDVSTQTQNYVGDMIPYNRNELTSLILGNLPETSGVIPYQTDMGTQTEWMNSKEAGFKKRDIGFATVEPSAMEFIGGMSYDPFMGVKHFRGGMAVQTELSKPPSGKNISQNEPAYTSTPSMSGMKERFYEDPQNRYATIIGTPSRHLSRTDLSRRVGEGILGAHHTDKRPFQGDSASTQMNSPM